MDKLQLTGQNLGRVFYFRNGHVHVVYFLCYGVKLLSLKLKNSAQTTFRFARDRHRAPRTKTVEGEKN
jgi:hypothetical protein